MFLDEKRFGEPQYLPPRNSIDYEDLLCILFLCVIFVFFKTINITAELTEQSGIADFCWVVSNTALLTMFVFAFRMFIDQKVKK